MYRLELLPWLRQKHSKVFFIPCNLTTLLWNWLNYVSMATRPCLQQWSSTIHHGPIKCDKGNESSIPNQCYILTPNAIKFWKSPLWLHIKQFEFALAIALLTAESTFQIFLQVFLHITELQEYGAVLLMAKAYLFFNVNFLLHSHSKSSSYHMVWWSIGIMKVWGLWPENYHPKTSLIFIFWHFGSIG